MKKILFSILTVFALSSFSTVSPADKTVDDKKNDWVYELVKSVVPKFQEQKILTDYANVAWVRWDAQGTGYPEFSAEYAPASYDRELLIIFYIGTGTPYGGRFTMPANTYGIAAHINNYYFGSNPGNYYTITSYVGIIDCDC